MHTILFRGRLNGLFASTAIAVTLLFFAACTDDPQPEPVELLTLAVEPSYDLGLDTWVFMHASDGSLLDHKQIAGTGSFTLSGAGLVDGDYVSLTVFNYDTANLNGNIRTTRGLFTYTSLPLHQSFVLAKTTTDESPNAGADKGKFYVTYQLPSGTTMDILGNGFSVGTFWKPSPDVKAGSVTVYEKSNDILLSMVANGTPRYQFFEDATVGATLNLTFDDLLEFDKVLSIALPSPSLNPSMQVLAYDDDGFNKYYTYNNTFNISPYTPSATYTSVKLGSLNKYTKYFVNLQIPQPDYFFSYMKVGEMPDALTLPPDAPFILTDRSFRDFNFEANTEYTFRTSNFRLKNTPPGDNTYWSITSPANNKVLQLPDEFITGYPSIIIENFQHLNSSFEVTTDSYLNRVDGMLRGSSGRAAIYEATVYGSIY